MMRELISKPERHVYEDNLVVVAAPEKAAAKGHLVVIPKKQVKSVEDLSEDELEHIFYVSSYSATMIFELLQAQGTNIISNEFGEEFYIEIIARTQDDNLDFQWKPKQVPTPEMDSVMSSISGKIMIGAESESKKDIKKEKKPAEKISESDDKDEDKKNYLLKQLNRVP